MTLQPLPPEFPYIWGKFNFFIIVSIYLSIYLHVFICVIGCCCQPSVSIAYLPSRMVKWYTQERLFWAIDFLFWEAIEQSVLPGYGLAFALWISAQRHRIITIFITYHYHLEESHHLFQVNPGVKVSWSAFCHGFAKPSWISQSSCE
jgi:hypothetical protein